MNMFKVLGLEFFIQVDHATLNEIPIIWVGH
jgi:hypothetical protein